MISTPEPLQLLASTPAGGFALQNGTPNILTYTAPADGQSHRVFLQVRKTVTVAEVGGAVQAAFNGTNYAPLFPGGRAPGTDPWSPQSAAVTALLAPGDTLTVRQTSALTGGASTVVIEFWGS